MAVPKVQKKSRASAGAKVRVRKLKGHTLRELAYGELLKSLLEGKFSPGEAVTIAELSGQLGIGLMPTREAVQQLASRGAFEFLPNRSVRVPVLADDELKALFEARILLEGFATARAAELCTREELAHVSASLETLIQRTRGRVAAECLEANYNFHFQIYRASQSPYVIEMIEHLWLRMSPLQNKVFRASRSEQDDFLSAMPKHRQLVDALQRHDAEKARSMITAMLQQSLRWHVRHA